MAKGNSAVKKVFTVIGNVIIWLFVIFAAIITVLTFAATSSEANVPTIAGRAILTVQTDSMSPTFDPGDIIIGQKITEDEAKTLKVDDVITYEADLDGDSRYELNSHRIVKVNKGDDGSVAYITRGDNNPGNDQFEVTPNNVICKYTGTRIKGLGKVLGFLQTSKGFLLCIVLPLVLFFIYELVIFIKKFSDMKNADKVKITAEDEERIRQAAIAEYLRAQAADKAEAPAEETEEVAEEPADEPEETAQEPEEATKEAAEDTAEEAAEAPEETAEAQPEAPAEETEEVAEEPADEPEEATKEAAEDTAEEAAEAPEETTEAQPEAPAEEQKEE